MEDTRLKVLTRGPAARERRHAELETEALDAAEELALARRADAPAMARRRRRGVLSSDAAALLGAIGVQTQIAAEAPVDED